MKKRLLPYLIFLPIILLVAYTDIDIYLKYMAIASIPLSIGLIVYMFIKSSAFYKTKKVLLFAIFALGLLVPMIPSHVYADAQSGPTSQTSFETERAKKELKNWEKYLQLKATLDRIGRIPKEQRSDQQKRDYEQAKKEFAKLNKDLNIEASCSTTQELQREVANNCWACDIANLFIEGADKVAINFQKLDKKNGISKSLLAIGLFAWILMHVLKLLMTFGRGDIGAFFTDLFLKLLLVGGIFIMISFPIRGVVNLAISPVFTLSATLGMQMGKMAAPEKIPDTLSAASDISKEQAVQIRDNVQKMFKQTSRCSYCVALEKGDESQFPIISQAMGHNFKQEERIVSGAMRNSLLCTICSIYTVTVEPTVVGQFLLCNAKNRTSTIAKFVPKEIITDWDALAAGLFLIIAFFSIGGLFSFYLIDTFFRIAIVLTILPLLIVAAAFKSTLTYTKKGLEIIIHAFFTYVILALFMTLVIQLYYHFLGGEAMDIFRIAFENNYDKLREAIAFRISGKIVAYSVGLALFVYFMLKHIDEYITSISGVSLSNSGGIRAFEQAKATATAVIAFVPKVFDQKWEGGGASKGNSAHQKASKIRQWGKERTRFEKSLDEKIDSKASKKIQQAEKLIKEGHKIRGNLAKMRAKTNAFMARRLSHTVIRTVMFLPKAIARNKYFNKTAGLAWQVVADGAMVTGAVWNGIRRGYNYLTSKKAARAKYFHRKK